MSKLAVLGGNSRKGSKSSIPAAKSSKPSSRESKSSKDVAKKSARKAVKAPKSAARKSAGSAVEGARPRRLSEAKRRHRSSMAKLPRFLNKVVRANVPVYRSDGSLVTPIPRKRIDNLVAEVIGSMSTNGLRVTRQARVTMSELAQDTITSIFNQSQVYACQRRPHAVLPLVNLTDMVLALDSCGQPWSREAIEGIVQRRADAGSPIGKVSVSTGRFVPKASFVPMTGSMAGRMASLSNPIRMATPRKGSSPTRAEVSAE